MSVICQLNRMSYWMIASRSHCVSRLLSFVVYDLSLAGINHSRLDKLQTMAKVKQEALFKTMAKVSSAYEMR